MTYEEASEAIKELPPHVFISVVKVAMWAAKGCEEHGLEVAYHDEDVIMFRRTRPLTQPSPENNPESQSDARTHQ